MKDTKKLTSEQKLFILDRLRLGCFIRHKIDDEMYYSESAVLQIIKEFNSVKFEQEQTDKKTKEELGDKLCEYCPLPEKEKGVYGVPGGFVAGCEGSRCKEAFENYQEQTDKKVLSAEEILETVMKENSFNYASFPAFVENENSMDVFHIVCKVIEACHSQFEVKGLREELMKFAEFINKIGWSIPKKEVDEYLKSRMSKQT